MNKSTAFGAFGVRSNRTEGIFYLKIQSLFRFFGWTTGDFLLIISRLFLRSHLFFSVILFWFAIRGITA